MNVENKTLKIIAEAEGWENASFSRLAGGDINEVFKVSAATEDFVLKINDAAKFPGMFEAEKESLEALGNSGAIRIPQVFQNQKTGNTAYLVLEFIPEGNAGSSFWQGFGQKMARLHQQTSEYFGFTGSNYIGSLPQYNEKCNSASEFYISQRLEPQIKMAHDKGFKFGALDRFYQHISEEIPPEKPALVHGDLWSGNFLISKNGEPVLIDPAVAYVHRELDIGMMHLFGGFNEELFNAYNSAFPLENGWKKRLPLWQLYYLLVHLNIFGSAYLSKVKKTIALYK